MDISQVSRVDVAKATIDALVLPTAADRRTALRKLVSDYLKLLPAKEHADLLKRVAELVAEWPGKRRTNITAVIQALPWQTLVAILCPKAIDDEYHDDVEGWWAGAAWGLADGPITYTRAKGLNPKDSNGEPIFGARDDCYGWSVEDALERIRTAYGSYFAVHVYIAHAKAALAVSQANNTANTSNSTAHQETTTMANLNLAAQGLGERIDAAIVAAIMIGQGGDSDAVEPIIEEILNNTANVTDLDEAKTAAKALLMAIKVGPGIPATIDEMKSKLNLDDEQVERAQQDARKVIAHMDATKELPQENAAMNTTATQLDVTNLPVNSALRPALDAIFAQATGGITFDDYSKAVRDLKDELSKAEPSIKRAAELEKQVDELARKVAMGGASHTQQTYATTGAIPQGKMDWKPAVGVFKELARTNAGKKLLAFDVPVFEWDQANPFVPSVDDAYEFDLGNTVALLMSVVYGGPIWLSGPTGSGKSSLVMQVAARLGMMVKRVNFDAEITRLDFIGRDTLVRDANGNTVSKFVDGVLPQAMAQPCILLLDEIDFIRPDVAAVLMPVCEMNGTPLVISEDGGRVVVPDQMFRIVATSNTKGAGDDTRAYQGTRPQSLALRNRFTGGFVEVDYLPEKSELKMLMGKVAGLKEEIAKSFVTAANEIRRAFVQGDIMETCSPRDLFAVSNSYMRFYSLTGDHRISIKSALELNLLNRANASEKQAMSEIIQRVIA